MFGFNTQPPEGGWLTTAGNSGIPAWFQHTAARRRLGTARQPVLMPRLFQHTAARRRLGWHTQ
ncbi:hypothetical protein [Kingella denitrificans]